MRCLYPGSHKTNEATKVPPSSSNDQKGETAEVAPALPKESARGQCASCGSKRVLAVALAVTEAKARGLSAFSPFGYQKCFNCGTFVEIASPIWAWFIGLIGGIGFMLLGVGFFFQWMSELGKSPGHRAATASQIIASGLALAFFVAGATAATNSARRISRRIRARREPPTGRTPPADSQVAAVDNQLPGSSSESTVDVTYPCVFNQRVLRKGKGTMLVGAGRISVTTDSIRLEAIDGAPTIDGKLQSIRVLYNPATDLFCVAVEPEDWIPLKVIESSQSSKVRANEALQERLGSRFEIWTPTSADSFIYGGFLPTLFAMALLVVPWVAVGMAVADRTGVGVQAIIIAVSVSLVGAMILILLVRKAMRSMGRTRAMRAAAQAT